MPRAWLKTSWSAEQEKESHVPNCVIREDIIKNAPFLCYAAHHTAPQLAQLVPDSHLSGYRHERLTIASADVVEAWQSLHAILVPPQYGQPRQEPSDGAIRLPSTGRAGFVPIWRKSVHHCR